MINTLMAYARFLNLWLPDIIVWIVKPHIATIKNISCDAKQDASIVQSMEPGTRVKMLILQDVSVEDAPRPSTTTNASNNTNQTTHATSSRNV